MNEPKFHIVRSHRHYDDDDIMLCAWASVFVVTIVVMAYLPNTHTHTLTQNIAYR